jgi:hypothetical protein
LNSARFTESDHRKAHRRESPNMRSDARLTGAICQPGGIPSGLPVIRPESTPSADHLDG